jgi:hypothetical protein
LQSIPSVSEKLEVASIAKQEVPGHRYQFGMFSNIPIGISTIAMIGQIVTERH